METWQKYIIGVAGLLLQGTAEPIVVQQSANWTSIIMAFMAGLPATIAAIVSGMVLLQSRRNAEVASKTEAAVKNNIEKTNTVIEKTTEIHTLTNSNLSKVQGQLDVATAKIEEFNKAQAESARKIANMELLITSLIPPKGEQSPSQVNGAKLDNLTNMLTNVQHGTPPIPVVDEAVLKKLDEQTQERARQATSTANTIVEKLDTIQESADAAAQQTAKEKRADES